MATSTLLWSFANIESSEPSRALALGSVPSAESLCASVVSKFGDAAKTGTLRVGMEQSKSDSEHLRVAVPYRRSAFGLFLQCQNGLSRTVPEGLASRP